MLEKTLKLSKHFIVRNYPLIIAVVLYCFFTIPALFHPHHSMHNLEPYPDGLLYVLSAESFATTGKLALKTAYSSISPWVPPLYPIILSLGFLFTSNPNVFLVVNVALGVVTISILNQIARHVTKSSVFQLLLLLLWLSHPVFVWLPSLPMSENLALPLITALFGVIFILKQRRLLLFAVVLNILLLLTRFSVVGISFVTIGLAILAQLKMKKSLTMLAGMGILIFIIFELVMRLQHSSAFSHIYSFVELLTSNSNIYSLRFILPNTIKYLNGLLLHKGQFLWQANTATSFAFVVASFWSVYSSVKDGNKVVAWQFMLLFIAVFSIPLVFYIPDFRYVIYVLPLMWTVVAIQLGRKPSVLFTAVVCSTIVINLVLGASLWQEVIVSNILGRSVGWQYEAIQHFGREMKEGDGLITAIPPHLVETYTTEQFRTYPLSKHQEFISKRMYVWGPDIEYTDLSAQYNTWLLEGRPLYISNAYITHSAEVVADYEAYKEIFNFELVSEGCLQACNIYKLSLKSSESTPSSSPTPPSVPPEVPSPAIP